MKVKLNLSPAEQVITPVAKKAPNLKFKKKVKPLDEAEPTDNATEDAAEKGKIKKSVLPKLKVR